MAPPMGVDETITMPMPTEAVTRILAAAQRRARGRGAAEALPVDLLWAILDDESRGAEYLLAAGFDRSRAGDDVFQAEGEAGLFDEVLEAAESLARDAGRHAELGSEHLLLGLLEVESVARRLLHEQDITSERLRVVGMPVEEEAFVVLPEDFSLRVEGDPLDRRGILRALDAAGNRASEGLRVCEDFTRFVLDDGHLTWCLKRLRHRVVELLSGVARVERLAARESQGDVGAGLENPSADDRKTGNDLLAANIHRAEEALRSLEEFSRLLDAPMAGQFEKLRYELYTLEKAITTVDSSRDRLRGRNVYLLLTQELCSLPVEDVLRGAATGGAGIVQVREKEMDDRELLAHLKMMREICRECDALLIVNDRPDLARLCGADGVHVGQEELRVADVRRIVGSDCLVGVSTHSIEQARAAVLDGADYLGIGPVFSSPTKAFGQFPGLTFVREVAGEIGCPWYAIGGIHEGNIAEVRAAGADRVAVSGAVCAADDPRVAAGRLRMAFEEDGG